MYRSIPSIKDEEYEHIVDARRSAIRYLERTGSWESVEIKERKRGVEGTVYRAKDPLTNKYEWYFMTVKGHEHKLNRNGSFKE